MDVLTAITDVFTAIGTWLTTALKSMIPVFYSEGLTFFGVLAVAGLAISVTFLVIGIIQNFLHFRG